MRTTEEMPVVVVSHPPRGGRDAERFARGMRAYGREVRARGIVVITHHDRGSDSPSVIVELDEDRAPAAFQLAERAGELLQRAGLATEFGRTHPREIDAWNALTAHATASFPMVRVSVPTRFGRDLTVLATAALLPLGSEGVLLIGLSDIVGEGVHRARRAKELCDAQVVSRGVEGVSV